jgi:hypothetical protein
MKKPSCIVLIDNIPSKKKNGRNSCTSFDINSENTDPVKLLITPESYLIKNEKQWTAQYYSNRSCSILIFNKDYLP